MVDHEKELKKAGISEYVFMAETVTGMYEVAAIAF